MVLTALLAKSAVLLAGTGLVTASVVGLRTDAVAAAGPTTSETRTTPAKQACRPPGLRVKHVPAALRKDLRAARQQLHDSDATGAAKRAERRAARERIRAAIADGTYGKDLQQRAQHRRATLEKRRAALPEQLRSDLAAVKELDPGPQRREAAAKVREARLDGTYGTTVQKAAEKVQQRHQRRQACQEQRRDRREKRSAVG